MHMDVVSRSRYFSIHIHLLRDYETHTAFCPVSKRGSFFQVRYPRYVEYKLKYNIKYI